MNQSAHSVLEAALALNETERADIAEKLLLSLGGTPQAEIDAAWIAEAESRIQAYREGKIRCYSAEDVFASLLPEDVE